MNIRRFFSNSSREALNMVRRQLGADAVILSNRSVDGGTEILAMNEHDMDQLIGEGGSVPLPAQFAGLGNTAGLAPEAEPARKNDFTDSEEPQSLLELLTSKNRVLSMPKTESVLPESAIPAAAPPTADASLRADFDNMMQEIKTMRHVLQSQLTEISWSSMQQRTPVRSELLNHLLNAGFSPGLSRQLAEKLPAQHGSEQALDWAQSVLMQNMQTIPDESEVLDRGGVFALIGPTGVGKTTTTAKLAARYVMKNGSANLGLITTDAYRIGGHEQLRIYGKILGVMVHAVKDEADLKIALQELKNKHTILIDTVGVSQRDRMVAEQISMLHKAGTDIKKLLCLNATCTGETLTDVIKAYRGHGLGGAIITKLDEAATIGSVLDILIREKLMLYYMASGQRVPEDLHIGNKQFLMQHAFKLGKRQHVAYAYRDEELPGLMAHTEPMAQSLFGQEANHA